MSTPVRCQVDGRGLGGTYLLLRSPGPSPHGGCLFSERRDKDVGALVLSGSDQGPTAWDLGDVEACGNDSGPTSQPGPPLCGPAEVMGGPRAMQCRAATLSGWCAGTRFRVPGALAVRPHLVLSPCLHESFLKPLESLSSFGWSNWPQGRISQGYERQACMCVSRRGSS